jgi:hypothetical protein
VPGERHPRWATGFSWDNWPGWREASAPGVWRGWPISSLQSISQVRASNCRTVLLDAFACSAVSCRRGGARFTRASVGTQRVWAASHRHDGPPFPCSH